MIKIGIVGASGYTARELVLILQRHPNIELLRATSRQSDGVTLGQSHPSIGKFRDLPFTAFDVDDFVSAGIECAFTCLPHGASAAAVAQLMQHGIKVVDFSADYRLNDVASFEAHYQIEHPDPQRVGQTAYGLPEIFRERIIGQDLIANPGCFPTSAILPLTPLVADGLVEPGSIIIDSKSGVSGAGRNPKPHLHFPEANESVMAYGIGTHRHGPEIEQILQRATSASLEVVFQPHLMPMDRGILSTIYFRPTENIGIENVKRSLQSKFADEPFIRLRDSAPTTKDVSSTNFCDIYVGSNREQIIIVSAIDNLIKGASGAAVQNFNLLFGFPETTALL